MKTSLIQSLGFNPVPDLPSCDAWDEVVTVSHDGLPGGQPETPEDNRNKLSREVARFSGVYCEGV